MISSQPPTRAQLHEQTCVRCDCAEGGLVPAGHVYTPTGPMTAPLGWAVVAHAGPCPEITSEEP